MRFSWWIVEFEYAGLPDGGVGLPVKVARHSVFTSMNAQKAIDATAILPGFIRVLAVRNSPAPLGLGKNLLINYYPGRINF